MQRASERAGVNAAALAATCTMLFRENGPARKMASPPHPARRGHYHTERFLLHVATSRLRHEHLSFRGFGSVQGTEPVVVTIASVARPDKTTDIHCVTKWSKFDTVWKGVLLRDLYDRAGRLPSAHHVIMHAEYGYTANVPLEDTLGDNCLLAYEYDGQPLEGEHGYPVRTLIPHLYFWKSVKWVRGIELVARDAPGFWERNGYHNYGDPFREQRFTDD